MLSDRDDQAPHDLRRAASTVRNHAERVLLLAHVDALAAVAISGSTLGLRRAGRCKPVRVAA